jgi:hypothetical protein
MVFVPGLPVGIASLIRLSPTHQEFVRIAPEPTYQDSVQHPPTRHTRKNGPEGPFFTGNLRLHLVCHTDTILPATDVELRKVIQVRGAEPRIVWRLFVGEVHDRAGDRQVLGELYLPNRLYVM